VSRTTVSFVLNDVADEKISEGTRARVLKATRELGYVPHAAGKALARRKTENVALVYTRSYHHIASHSILLRLIDGLMEVVHARNLRLMIDAVDESTSGTSVLRLARANHIDGLIMLEPRNDDQQLLALARDGFPVVLVGSLPGSGLCSIDIDNREAARLSVEHLINLGHTRIGCITNAPPVFTAAAARLTGYNDAMRRHGIPARKSLVRYGGFNPESGYEAMRSLLKEKVLPTAVFIASDTVAIGSLRALAERGIHVPRDMAVFGFDDVVDSRYASPPLSTVSFPVEQHGRRSAEILFELMSGTLTPPYHETTPFQIVIRASSVGDSRAAAATGKSQKKSQQKSQQPKRTSSSNWKDRQSEEVSQ
jgi:DNA-binding LacI/PurR family transcriptional regulator